MTRTSLLLALAVLTTALTASLAVAGHDEDAALGSFGGPGFGGAPGSRLMHIADELELTDEQIDQVRDITSAYREQRRDDRAAMRDLRASLREATQAQPYDAARVEELARQISSLTTDEIIARSATFAEVMTILTPEQRAQMEELRENRRGHWKRHRRGRQ